MWILSVAVIFVLQTDSVIRSLQRVYVQHHHCWYGCLQFSIFCVQIEMNIFYSELKTTNFLKSLVSPVLYPHHCSECWWWAVTCLTKSAGWTCKPKGHGTPAIPAVTNDPALLPDKHSPLIDISVQQKVNNFKSSAIGGSLNVRWKCQ